MTKQIITQDVYFARTDEGKHIALRVEAPYFCFEADTQDEVRQIAKDALDFYFSRDQ